MAPEPQNSGIDLAMQALGDYLKLKMPPIEQVVQDFPTPNQQLKYPSISLTHTAGPGSYTNLMPYEWADPAAPVNNQTQVVYICGQWDFKIQVDLWTRSKPERDKIFALFHKVFNLRINPMGLSLPLPKFFGVTARYDMEGFDHKDGEQAAQRGEWRTLVSLLASVPDVLSNNEYVITKPIDLQVTVLDTNQSIGP